MFVSWSGDFAVSVINVDSGARIPQRVPSHPVEAALEATNGAMFGRELDPGQDFVEEVNVDSLFDLSQRGNYSIQLSLAGDPRVQSNVLQVSLPPRPTARMVASESAMRMLSDQAVGRLPIPASQSPFALSIEVDDEAIYPGVHVPVHTTLSNRTDRAIEMNVAGAGGDYVVEARDVATGDVPLDKSLNAIRRSQVASDSAPGEAHSMSPKTTLVGTLDLQYYVDLSKPGTYAIQLWRKLPDSLGAGEVRSNVVTVTVVDRPKPDGKP